MGSDLTLLDVLGWITHVFPSLTQYGKIILPAVLMLISVIGIFSNILPKPGDPYPVPDLDDINAELKGKGRITYYCVIITRRVTLGFNYLIRTKVYACFYTTTKVCSNLIARVKGHRESSEMVEITKPKPPTFKRLKMKRHDKPRE